MNFVAQVYAFGVARIGYAGRNTFKCSKRATFMWSEVPSKYFKTAMNAFAFVCLGSPIRIRWAVTSPFTERGNLIILPDFRILRAMVPENFRSRFFRSRYLIILLGFFITFIILSIE